MPQKEYTEKNIKYEAIYRNVTHTCCYIVCNLINLKFILSNDLEMRKNNDEQVCVAVKDNCD